MLAEFLCSPLYVLWGWLESPQGHWWRCSINLFHPILTLLFLLYFIQDVVKHCLLDCHIPDHMYNQSHSWDKKPKLWTSILTIAISIVDDDHKPECCVGNGTDSRVAAVAWSAVITLCILAANFRLHVIGRLLATSLEINFCSGFLFATISAKYVGFWLGACLQEKGRKPLRQGVVCQSVIVHIVHYIPYWETKKPLCEHSRRNKSLNGRLHPKG